MPQMEVSMYKPVPAGTYHLAVKGCREQKPGQNSSNKDPFLSWEFEILDDEELQGKSFNWATSKKIGKGSKAYNLLLACGLDDTDEDFAFDTDQLIGCVFYAVVIVEDKKTGSGQRNAITAFISEDEFPKYAEKTAKLMKLNKPHGAGPGNPLAKAEAKAPAEPEAEAAEAEASAAPPEQKAPAGKKSGHFNFPK